MDIQLFPDAFAFSDDIIRAANLYGKWEERCGYYDFECTQKAEGNVDGQRHGQQLWIRNLPLIHLQKIETVIREHTDNALQLMPMRLLKYEPGDFYGPHTDYCAMRDGQKIRTTGLYLNTCVGGDLFFPHCGVRVTPQPGLFGSWSPELLHESQPVTAGTKYVIITFLGERCTDREVVNINESA